jgi:hypothetical protein
MFQYKKYVVLDIRVNVTTAAILTNGLFNIGNIINMVYSTRQVMVFMELGLMMAPI